MGANTGFCNTSDGSFLRTWNNFRNLNYRLALIAPRARSRGQNSLHDGASSSVGAEFYSCWSNKYLATYLMVVVTTCERKLDGF